LLRDYDFDDELRGSAVYARTLANGMGSTTSGHLRASFQSIGSSSSSVLTALQHGGPNESVATPSGSENAENRSVTTSFGADVQSLEGDDWADAVNRPVHLIDDHGKSQLLSALLDTGANRNFISESKVSMLRLGAATMKLVQPRQISAANGSITVLHKVKVKWRFVNETVSYTYIFYVVPGLEHEIVIGRNFIFEHGLLTNNLELRSPNPQGEDQSVPELLIMGMSKLSKGEFHGQLHLGEYADVPIAGKKDQDERTAAKEKENQTQRDKEANEIRERLAAQASSSTAPANAGGAGGAASSSGSSNATK
jgi:hypothetical protein